MPSPVIDLSHHNPEPDFAKVKASGVTGCIHKATENVSYADPKRASRLSKALQAGLCISTYHFMRPNNIEKQMDWYLSVIDPVDGERVCLDYEDDAIPISQLEQAVNYLWSKRPDLQITIYSGHTIKEKLGNTRNATLAKTSLWIAQYTSASSPSWPQATWPAWSLWQWTDRETISGISQPVDGNRWNGSPEDLVTWMNPAGQIPAPEPAPTPEPPPTPEPVVVQMQVVTSAPVTLIINGQEVLL